MFTLDVYTIVLYMCIRVLFICAGKGDMYMKAGAVTYM